MRFKIPQAQGESSEDVGDSAFVVSVSVCMCVIVQD